MDQKSTFKLFAFGITVDILGTREMEIPIGSIKMVKDLRTFLFEQYPPLGNLVSLKIAINDEYVTDEDLIQMGDEVILIPPVSGG
jgi:molybdopterin converting factor small subunit